MPTKTRKSTKTTRSNARKAYEKVKKTSKLGSGKRFSALQKSIQSEGYSKKAAGAIAASAGRKAHGKKKMAQLSRMGRKKK
jgi:hypothetical protein